jgi:hypothetical protein
MRGALALRHLDQGPGMGLSIKDFFGEMLMGFEGWQLKLEIGDRSEEI